MSQEILDALTATPLLAGMSAGALAMLADEGSVHEFEPGKLIVREGESGHALFILVVGEVEVIKHFGRPHAVSLARLHARTFFGEMCVVDPVPRAASVLTVGQVRVIEITAGMLYHLFRKMPDQYAILLLNLARDMARRLRTLDEAFAARAS